MNPKTVIVEGFFYVGGVSDKSDPLYPDLSRAYLDEKLFKFSCRKFNLPDLQVLPLERLQGSLFKTREVQGVVNTKGSLIPFFIERHKVPQLQNLICRSRDPSEVVL